MSPPFKLPSISRSLRFCTPPSDWGSLSFHSGSALVGGLGVVVASCEARGFCVCEIQFGVGGIKFRRFKPTLPTLSSGVGRGGCAGDPEGDIGERRGVSLRCVAALSWGTIFSHVLMPTPDKGGEDAHLN